MWKVATYSNKTTMWTVNKYDQNKETNVEQSKEMAWECKPMKCTPFNKSKK